MFTNKKDEEIKELKAQIEVLESSLLSEEKLRIDIEINAEREHTNFLFYKKEMLQREEEFNIEIARLKRIAANEKKKRINSACANRRRQHGRNKN